MFETNTVVYGLVATAVLFYFWRLRSTKSKLPYPPSPPKHWLLGHAQSFFTPNLWNLFTSWRKDYGDVIHLEALGSHSIVLNSLDDAIELLEKRSNNYSDRPYIPMVELTKWSYATPFKGHTPEWQRHRRLFQQEFKATAVVRFREQQSEKIIQLLYNLLDTPEDFMAHIRTLSAAIIMSTVYGYNITSTKDKFITIAEEALSRLSESTSPGARLVNVMHSLRYLPVWFPGAGFHNYAKDVSKLTSDMQLLPYEYTQKSIADGTAVPCVVSSLIDNCKTPEDHHLLQEVAGTGYSGGADTTTSAIATFFLAMVNYPDVQKKAQEELDRVVGTERMVSFDDDDALPYVHALVREVLRWRPVLPLSVPHASSADDVYKGWFIPKGTTIMANVWAMSRDPRRYTNAEEFMPERFFTAEGALNDDNVSYTFGFGRRMCPGRFMGYATVWLAVARLLSTFDIKRAKDAEGRNIPLSGEYTDGLIVHPLPFECRITPRSEKARELVVHAALGI